MFWRMTGLSTASPVDVILDKENYTLEELLDEDEIVQECKGLNNRLINFLRERSQVEQLLHYVVEEAPKDVEKKRSFKFPFIACEIFTCEVDIILRTLVEDEELMDLLFSFLKPDRPHSTLLAGCFNKVVLCLMARKTSQLMSYVQGHPEIFNQLVDLIGITSMMEVLIRLIGADENMCSNYMDAFQSLEGTDVLDLIVDKFSSTDSPEVHANAAEVLCAITRYAPPGLAAKICSPSFVGRLFHYALEDSRPRSVLVHSLSVCISLLDPKRLVQPACQSYRNQINHGKVVIAYPETVDGMLESVGELLKLLDVSTSEVILPTTYGSLKPPVGKHRLKIVEFISVLLTIGCEDAEKELIHLGALRRVLDLFFEYPYNNFLHHQVESIIGSCLESKSAVLVEHLLHDCDIVGKILGVEKQPILSTSYKTTLFTEGRSPPRIGNIGHLAHIANKLIQAANTSGIIQTHLQENNEWVDWHTNVLVKRNAVENVYNWACGRPTSLHDRAKDSDDEDFRDRDYDVAALASNLSQAFRYNIYGNDDIEEANGSLERDEEDVYFDDDSAEVVISSLRLGDDKESSSLFTNSNWFAFEEDRSISDRATGSLASPSSNSNDNGEIVDEGEELDNKSASLEMSDSNSNSDGTGSIILGNGTIYAFKEDGENSCPNEKDKPVEWVEWTESTSGDSHGTITTTSANGEIDAREDDRMYYDDIEIHEAGRSPENANPAAKDSPVTEANSSVSQTKSPEIANMSSNSRPSKSTTVNSERDE